MEVADVRKRVYLWLTPLDRQMLARVCRIHATMWSKWWVPSLAAQATAGQVSVLYAETLRTPNPRKMGLVAAAHSNIALLDWLMDASCAHLTSEICWVGAQNGHLPVVQWVYESDRVIWNEWATVAAAGRGHLHVLKWISEAGCPCSWDKTMVSAAVYGRHLATLQWLHAHMQEC